jgi:hypothetical protein
MVTTHLRAMEKRDEDYFFGVYMDEGTLRKTFTKLGEELGLERDLTRFAWYKWLDSEPGRRARWKQLLRDLSVTEADRLVTIADTVTDDSARVDTVKIRALQAASNTRAIGADSGKDEQKIADLGTLIGGILKGMENRTIEAIPEAEWSLENPIGAENQVSPENPVNPENPEK